jgi:hypothetical protein
VSHVNKFDVKLAIQSQSRGAESTFGGFLTYPVSKVELEEALHFAVLPGPMPEIEV